MSWRTVASKDYREAKDSRLLRYLVYLFVVVCLFGGYLFPVVTDGDVTTDRFAGFMTGAIGLLLPLVGLLLGYNAVVGERESGRLTLLLSLPHDRRDVVLGKLLGRGLVLVLAVVVGLVAAGALVVYPFGSLSAVGYLAYIGLTLLFGGVFLGLAMTISTLVTSKKLATASVFGLFFVFVVVWEELRQLLAFGLDRAGVADGGLPDWALFVHGAEPGALYDRVVAAFFEGSSTGPYLGPDASWYLNEWVALVLLVTWAVVPITVGYRRFENTDL